MGIVIEPGDLAPVGLLIKGDRFPPRAVGVEAQHADPQFDGDPLQFGHEANRQAKPLAAGDIQCSVESTVLSVCWKAVMRLSAAI